MQGKLLLSANFQDLDLSFFWDYSPKQDFHMALARFTNRTYRIVVLILISTLAGCTGFMPDLPVDFVVDADREKGIVVGSVGTNPLGKQWREWSRYEYRSVSDEDIRGHVTSAVNWSNPFYPQPECPDDGLPEECANLFAIVLPVGEYEFWAVTPAMDSLAARTFGVWATQLKGFHFEVKSGQATYIGNMLSRLCGGSSHSYYGIASIGSARAAQGDVADRYDRDIPLLVQKFPQLQNTPINNETMTGISWRWDFKQSEEDSITTNWEKDCVPTRSPLSEPSAKKED